jgi:Holliday junction resolvase-like predicted endonuclease
MCMTHVTKDKGDLAELMVAADLMQQGWRVAFPYGEAWSYDLIAERDGEFSRVQVKHVTSDGKKIQVPCRSISVTNGKATNIFKYTSANIDMIAVYEAKTQRCYYVPAVELGDGMAMLTLRLIAPKQMHSNQITRYAEAYRRMEGPVKGWR